MPGLTFRTLLKCTQLLNAREVFMVPHWWNFLEIHLLGCWRKLFIGNYVISCNLQWNHQCGSVVWPLPLVLGIYSLRLWNALSDKSIFVTILDANKVWSQVWWPCVISSTSMPKVSHTDDQLCLCDPVKSLGTKAWVNFPDWQYS